ncbi:MAG TPA: UDP-N-acetylmuramoyl-tripeptide--D-alanyl-D-alanine ligase [Ilumatobacter sp.]|nr:UDP-N-acetylmuramoyl-tripeptide--D-alanyl-D-alanine ligase [Ilumatobacter sp.]
MRMLASQVAEAAGGAVVGPDVVIEGASFDSRTIVAGQLFVPLIAERDGHEFISRAVEGGAVAYLTSRGRTASLGATAILVDDTADALMRLAAWGRQRLPGPVVAVTGSVGKTSTKDLVRAALAPTFRVAANERSYNNEQGLPVTVLGAPDDTEVLVVEMGMRGFGEITRLCDVARPSIGVVTAVAGAHTERVGGIEGVAVAKRELVEALPAGGVAVLNGDDARVAAMAAYTDATVVMYGRLSHRTVDEVIVVVADLELDAFARPRFTVQTPWGSERVELSVSGEHMAFNAAAAIAVAGVLHGSIEAAVAALEHAKVSAHRMQVGRALSGATIVDDAYNANPDSMRAALNALAAMSARRRVAVLGRMAELDDPEAGHRQVAADAAERRIELIAVGTDLYGVEPAADTASAVAAVGELNDGDAVLVKASNSAELWHVAEALLG